MAGVAEVAGWDVVRRLPARLDAVVAAEAVCPGRRVGKAGERKRTRVMAAVALVRGWQVVHRLAERPDAVVTAGAGTNHFQMIDPNHRLPGSRLVTARALIGGQDVVRGLLSCSDKPVLSMAAGAGGGNRTEIPAFVAACAARARVRADELEAGGEMVKTRLLLAGGFRTGESAEKHGR